MSTKYLFWYEMFHTIKTMFSNLCNFWIKRETTVTQIPLIFNSVLPVWTYTAVGCFQSNWNLLLNKKNYIYYILLLIQYYQYIKTSTFCSLSFKSPNCINLCLQLRSSFWQYVYTQTQGRLLYCSSQNKWQKKHNPLLLITKMTFIKLYIYLKNKKISVYLWITEHFS